MRLCLQKVAAIIVVPVLAVRCASVYNVTNQILLPVTEELNKGLNNT